MINGKKIFVITFSSRICVESLIILMQQDVPAFILTSLKTNQTFKIFIQENSDIDTLLYQIDDEDYKLEILHDLSYKLDNLMLLIQNNNNYYCCCQKKEYSKKDTVCENLNCKKPLSRIKILKMICSTYSIFHDKSQINILKGFDNLQAIKLCSGKFLCFTYMNFSYLKNLKQIHFFDCIFPNENMIYFLENMDQLEHLIIEGKFLNKSKDLKYFFDTLKNKKRKLKILEFVYPDIYNEIESSIIFYNTLIQYLNDNSIAEKVYLTDEFINIFTIDILISPENNTFHVDFNFIRFLNEIRHTRILKRLTIKYNGYKLVPNLHINSYNQIFCQQQFTILLDKFMVENKSLIKFDWITDKDDSLMKLLDEKIRIRNLESPVHNLFMNNCIAFLPIQLPPYVLLEIFDWLPDCSDNDLSHFKKIRLIEKIIKFYKRKNSNVVNKKLVVNDNND